MQQKRSETEAITSLNFTQRRRSSAYRKDGVHEMQAALKGFNKTSN
jgi:hypothetical protein